MTIPKGFFDLVPQKSAHTAPLPREESATPLVRDMPLTARSTREALTDDEKRGAWRIADVHEAAPDDESEPTISRAERLAAGLLQIRHSQARSAAALSPRERLAPQPADARSPAPQHPVATRPAAYAPAQQQPVAPRPAPYQPLAQQKPPAQHQPVVTRPPAYQPAPQQPVAPRPAAYPPPSARPEHTPPVSRTHAALHAASAASVPATPAVTPRPIAETKRGLGLQASAAASSSSLAGHPETEAVADALDVVFARIRGVRQPATAPVTSHVEDPRKRGFLSRLGRK